MDEKEYRQALAKSCYLPYPANYLGRCGYPHLAVIIVKLIEEGRLW